jgi:hypothetical protein
MGTKEEISNSTIFAASAKSDAGKFADFTMQSVLGIAKDHRLTDIFLELMAFFSSSGDTKCRQ